MSVKDILACLIRRGWPPNGLDPNPMMPADWSLNETATLRRAEERYDSRILHGM
jgi:hypothetical protein